MAGLTTMTAEEFYDWANLPENRNRLFELEKGEIVEMSRPGERHGVVCGNIAWVLGSYVRQRKAGYVCSNDMGIILERDPDTVRGPDIVVYLEARKYDELKVKYPDRLPALVVEVISPTDTYPKMLRRVNQFLAKGVALVWLVDPDARTVMVWRPQQLQLVLEGNDELTGLDVLPDFRCRVAEFFVMPGEAAG